MQYPVTGFALNTSRLAAIGCLFATMVALAGCSKIELDRNEGAPLVWSDLRGQWVLVNYWAEWCKPCLKEFPN
ncbi:TlpA family protein disulfide reductase [Marinobacter sp. BSs20148]|uniref:TlpA family protein disulfide reductase n=1 Tax=Marinobacter sp. BSs20148 TaxID=490759 RepID=UPI0002776A59|nr:redoxin domain-containing protein [Marinobacter sp. BSs20148]AFP30362.1 hypothetical protein MRBBS_1424 [Marinobacter sp. BSs20148]